MTVNDYSIGSNGSIQCVLTADQSIPDDTPTLILYANPVSTIPDVTYNSGSFTINTTGLYSFCQMTYWQGVSNNIRASFFSVNENIPGLTLEWAYSSVPGGNTGVRSVSSCLIKVFNAGDVVRGGCYQDSGNSGGLNLLGSGGNNSIIVVTKI